MEEVTPCIIFDCSEVTYIGSAQLNELVDFTRFARLRGGDLKYVGLPQAIRHLADLIAKEELMGFYDDMPQALEAFRGLAVRPSTPSD
jgi:anti-anti-sigma regulatory factor